jgi:hypothetical protein
MFKPQLDRFSMMVDYRGIEFFLQPRGCMMDGTGVGEDGNAKQLPQKMQRA